jgi:S1-C subfamily serine protease
MRSRVVFTSVPLFLVALAAALPLGCGSTPPATAPARPTAQAVFDMAAPSVVAVLDDDEAEREQAIKDFEKTMGDEAHAPKHVIDVSTTKDPMPDGTGFAIEPLAGTTGNGGLVIVTAAHVVERPDKLKITTRSGQTVECDLERIDEVRDVAILKPRAPLNGVPPLKLADRDPDVGQTVWAMGHTGAGFWKLAWGMSEGIASGIVDVFGAKRLLFDAKTYPGFSGGPIVTIGPDGRPRVVAITRGVLFVANEANMISFGPSISEVRDVAEGHPPAIEATLAAYAKAERAKQYADLFITDSLSVARDANDQPVARIAGNETSIDVDDDGTRIPTVAMLFGLPPGSNEVTFEVHDPVDATVASETTTVRVADKQRVAFASSKMDFKPKTHGKFAVLAKLGTKEIGRSYVNLELGDDDDDLVDDNDADGTDDGNPDVDVVVARMGMADPLLLQGVSSAWAERSYPRRISYTWFARATRGWSGRNVSIAAFVLDESGHIVGRSQGCFKDEVRPELVWGCGGLGGSLPNQEGRYDLVFALNDRPVAWWPMEAMIRTDHAPGSDLDRWMRDVKRAVAKRRRNPVPAPAPLPPAPPQPPGRAKH